MFTERQKRVVEKWLKVHGGKKNSEVRHEDFWKLFKKSTIKDLIEEFNDTADKDGV